MVSWEKAVLSQTPSGQVVVAGKEERGERGFEVDAHAGIFASGDVAGSCVVRFPPVPAMKLRVRMGHPALST